MFVGMRFAVRGPGAGRRWADDAKIIAVGAAFVVLALLLIPRTQDSRVNNPVITTATVTDVERTTRRGACYVTVTYEVGWDSLTSTSSYGSSSMCGYRPGERVEITHDRNRPSVFTGLDVVADGIGLWIGYVALAGGAALVGYGVRRIIRVK